MFDAITLWQALLIAIWMGLVLSRLSIATLHLRLTTLMTALVVGIVMGNVPVALSAGVAIQLALFNVGGAGGSASAEPAFATALVVPIVIMGGLGPFQSVVLAIPLGILGSYLYKARFSANTKFMKSADEHAEALDESGLTQSIMLKPFFTSFIAYTLIMFVFIFIGSPLLSNLLEGLVQGTFGHVLDVIGRGLSAAGLAAGMVAMGKAKHLPFFFIAYILAMVLPRVSMLTFAVLAAAIAVIYIMASEPEAIQED
jgi:PTS system mannose-specific IIC component